MLGYVFCSICLKSKSIKSEDVCTEGATELSDGVNEFDSGTLVKSILSLIAGETGNVMSRSTSSSDDLYSANSLANFNRGPAGGIRIFIVSLSTM